jgi:antitoxin (DNA-binding transcriptional repressor) of toxin-antitoxin stability system
MKRVTVAQFGRRYLKILDAMSLSREPVLITKKGKPIAKLVCPDAQTSDDIFGCMRDEMKIVGDIESPAIPPEDWESLK